VIFKLAPNSTSNWTETVLHSFTGGSDGKATEGVPLTSGPDGNLYGTAAQGGTANLHQSSFGARSMSENERSQEP
jgi:hypothetical protein